MTQKPPKFTGTTVDLDDEDAGHEDHAEQVLPEDRHDGEATGYEFELDADGHEDDELGMDSDLDAQRQKAKLIYYAVLGLFGLLIVFIGFKVLGPLFQHQDNNAQAGKAPVITQPAPKYAANNASSLPAPALPTGAALAPLPLGSNNAGGAPSTNSSAQLQNKAQNNPLPAAPSPAAPTPAATVPVPFPTPAALNGNTQAVAIPGQIPQAQTAPSPAIPATPNSAIPNFAAPSPASGLPPQPASIQAINPSKPVNPVMPAVAPTPVAPQAPTSTLSNPNQPAMPAAPNSTVVTGSDPRVDDLASKVASLQASQKITTTQLQQIQSSLDALQKQIGQVTITTAHEAPAVEKTASRPVTHRTHQDTDSQAAVAPPVRAAHTSWVLRSATPSGALLGHSSTGEVQRVAVGDVVNGLGRITYIGEKNGRWVVQGVNGSVSQ